MSDDLIALAASRGWLDESTARARLDARAATPGALVEFGLLDPGRASALAAERSIGKYVRLCELGSGGFGRVWLGWDEALRRRVAIKVLHGQSPDDVERFKREARAAARLAHPNIIPIHDVGEVGGEHFIVMEFIDGARADDARRTEREAAELIRQAAEALHHAHERGIVHRDVKPANILVAAGRAFVGDFGLAKALAGDASLSMTGDVMGTPQFMAPEQARGQIRLIDRRTDVWGLGATLYGLLSGRSPFEAGETDAYDVLRRVVDEDPPPPKASRDLTTIVLKCLEKDPARRYATARALADDLARFLAGDAIEGRPASAAYRLGRRMRKHPVASALLGAAAAAVLAALGVAVWQFGEAIDQRDAVQRRAEELDRALLAMEISSAYWAMEVRVREGVINAEERGHRASREQRDLWVEEVRLAAEQIGRTYPRAGVVDAYEALILCLVGREAEGLERFQLAEHKAPQDPFVPLWRARARLAVYFRRLEIVDLNAGGATPIRFIGTPVESEAMREALAQAEADLIPAESYALWDLLREGRNLRTMARAALAFMRRDYAEAERLAAGIVMDAAAGAEARRLLGLARFYRGDFAGALEAFVAARAERPAGGQLACWEVFGRLAVASELAAAGGDPEPHYAAAAEAMGQALAADPESAGLLIQRSALSVLWARDRMDRGRDAGPVLAAAVDAGTAAIGIDPGRALPYVHRGTAYRCLGELGDAGAFDRALADFQEAVRRDPESRAGRGAVYWKRGDAVARAGGDPREDYGRAIADLEPAATAAEYLNDLGSVYCYLADAQASFSVDPRPSLTKAIETFTRAMEIAPDYAPLYSNRSNAHRAMADVLLALRLEATPSCLAAIADADEAVRRRPDLPDVRAIRGNAHLELALIERRRPDPEAMRAALDRAEADFKAAVSLRADHWMAISSLGIVLELRGDVAGAIERYEAALELSPGDARILESLRRARASAREEF